MGGLLKRLLDKRFRISTQLYLAIGGTASLTIVASLVAWLSFDYVGRAQRRVNEGSVPFMASAFEIAQKSSALVSAAPRLSTIVIPEELDKIATEVARDRKAFEEALLRLLRQEGGQQEISLSIRDQSATLIANIESIRQLVLQRFELTDLRDTLELQHEWVRKELTKILVPLIDDQLFYAMTGYRDIGEPRAPRAKHFTEEEFNLYRYAAGLKFDATVAEQLLVSVFNVSDPALLVPLQERLQATERSIRRNLAALGDAPVRALLEPLFDRMFDLTTGEEGGLELRVRELELERRQRDLLAFHSILESDILSTAESLVSQARASAREATVSSDQAIGMGTNLLLALSVVSLVGAFLIAWLFVGRMLLRRIGYLSARMRRMAEGELEEEVDLGGRDEVSEMGSALEVFRRHALEVQRLNLVEKLAEELQGKNHELEAALGDLEKAQDQIVMREKLAALGELTAGVAHEIRNPLNFIKNFSEVSEELLEEMLEEMEKVVAAGGETNGSEKREQEQEQKEEDDPIEIIHEIRGDLTTNLQRIREHGDRANSIVESMLQMGRGSGDPQPTNINHLLNEHARLAFHSARASDPNFNLTIQEDYDESVGEQTVVPQDLGRVFLNMVSNACYATNQKRMTIKESADGPRYNPTLSLATRKLTGHIEIRIRDNGCGMPPEVVKKVFDPFFTTKPTADGTGLGLSLSSDIVRQHGGSIRVETEPDEFTEMIIELPAAS